MADKYSEQRMDETLLFKHERETDRNLRNVCVTLEVEFERPIGKYAEAKGRGLF
jgi:hypothetical protein